MRRGHSEKGVRTCVHLRSTQLGKGKTCYDTVGGILEGKCRIEGCCTVLLRRRDD